MGGFRLSPPKPGSEHHPAPSTSGREYPDSLRVLELDVTVPWLLISALVPCARDVPLHSSDRGVQVMALNMVVLCCLAYERTSGKKTS